MNNSFKIETFKNLTETIEEILYESETEITFSSIISGRDTEKKLGYQSIEKNLVIKKNELKKLDYDKIKKFLLLLKDNKKLLEVKELSKMDKLEDELKKRDINYKIDYWTNKG